MNMREKGNPFSFISPPGGTPERRRAGSVLSLWTGLLSILLLLLPASPSHAAFELSPGKRINALGGAAAASAGDPMGFFYNPSSAAWSLNSAFETQYSRLFWGLEGDELSRTALGGYLPLGSWGSGALGYDRF